MYICMARQLKQMWTNFKLKQVSHKQCRMLQLNSCFKSAREVAYWTSLQGKHCKVKIWTAVNKVQECTAGLWPDLPFAEIKEGRGSTHVGLAWCFSIVLLSKTAYEELTFST